MSSGQSDQTSGTRAHEAGGPTYFTSLSVENVRCFGPEQSLDLCDSEGHHAPWTVILGENGTGKTTLLQCLASMELAWETVPASDVSEGSEGEDVELAPVIFKTSSSDDRLYSLVKGWYQDSLNLGGRNWKLTSGYESLEDSEVPGHLTVTGDGLGSADSDLAGNGKPLPCFGYGAIRVVGEPRLGDQERPGPTAGLFSEEVKLLNPEEWLLQLDYSSKQTGPVQEWSRRQFDKVRVMLVGDTTDGGLLPDVDDLRVTPPSEGRKYSRTDFHTPYGWVPFDGLGLGYRTMVAWVVDLASRMFDAYPNSEDPISEPAAVLVDEVDLHLHPIWERSIMEYLTKHFPRVQFVVTAHSPLVVQSARLANIVVLRRKVNDQGDDYVVIESDPKTISNWRVDQVLTSLFGLPTARPKELEHLIVERRKILSQPTLTPGDEERIRAINDKISELPTGETSEDVEAMEVIRRAAAILER